MTALTAALSLMILAHVPTPAPVGEFNEVATRVAAHYQVPLDRIKITPKPEVSPQWCAYCENWVEEIASDTFVPRMKAWGDCDVPEPSFEGWCARCDLLPWDVSECGGDEMWSGDTVATLGEAQWFNDEYGCYSMRCQLSRELSPGAIENLVAAHDIDGLYRIIDESKGELYFNAERAAIQGSACKSVVLHVPVPPSVAVIFQSRQIE